MPEIDQLPPDRLGALVSWQAGRIATLGARLFARDLPLGARGDFAVLAVVEESGPPLSQADIGRRLGLDRNDVNEILNRLETSGAVLREPDPGDRRRKVVTITKGGRSYLGEIQDTADAVQADLLHALDADERHQLHTLMEKLLRGHPVQPA